MKRQGILIDLQSHKIVKRAEYDDKRVDDIYVKFDGEIYPAAYIYPAENEQKVIEQLERLKIARKAWDDLTAEVYYKILPTLR